MEIPLNEGINSSKTFIYHKAVKIPVKFGQKNKEVTRVKNQVKIP